MVKIIIVPNIDKKLIIFLFDILIFIVAINPPTDIYQNLNSGK